VPIDDVGADKIYYPKADHIFELPSTTNAELSKKSKVGCQTGLYNYSAGQVSSFSPAGRTKSASKVFAFCKLRAQLLNLIDSYDYANRLRSLVFILCSLVIHLAS